MRRLIPLLIRLYPRRWRERYEAEFLALLEDRPPSYGDAPDILRHILETWFYDYTKQGARRMSTFRKTVLSNALLFGGLISLISALHMLLSTLASTPRVLWGMTGLVYLFVLLSLCMFAGWRLMKQTNTLIFGVMAGALAAAISGVLYAASLFAVSYTLVDAYSGETFAEVVLIMVSTLPTVIASPGLWGAGAGLAGALAYKNRGRFIVSALLTSR